MSHAVEDLRRTHPARDLVAQPALGGLACYAGPGSPMNKVLGIGFAGVPSSEQLDAIEQVFFSRREHVQFEISTLADPGLATALTRRGYAVTGYEQVLGLRLPADLPEIAQGITIEIADKNGDGAQNASWIDAAVTGFLTPDEQGAAAHESFDRGPLEAIFKDAVGDAQYRRWSALVDGQLAGTAAMNLSHGFAQLCGAATLPEFRRRGVQTALLTERLRCAHAEGLETVIMETNPGSKSQENAQKRGFELLYVRGVFVKSAS